jgi:hypothetical protein
MERDFLEKIGFGGIARFGKTDKVLAGMRRKSALPMWLN